MASMTADNTLREYLLRAKEVTEIRDADGEVLGYYAPAAVAEHVHEPRQDGDRDDHGGDREERDDHDDREPPPRARTRPDPLFVEELVLGGAHVGPEA